MKQLATVLAWLSRYWILIISLCAVVVVGATLKACHEAGRVQQAIADNPLLPKKQARKLIAQSKADSTTAVVYKAIAAKAKTQRDSALVIARASNAKTDSLHAEIKAMPAATGGPLSAVAKRLANFADPDTTGY